MTLNRRSLFAAVVAFGLGSAHATSSNGAAAPPVGVGRRRRRSFSWGGMAGVGIAGVILWMLAKPKK